MDTREWALLAFTILGQTAAGLDDRSDGRPHIHCLESQAMILRIV